MSKEQQPNQREYLDLANKNLRDLSDDLEQLTWEEFLHLRSGFLGIVLNDHWLSQTKGDFERRIGDYRKRSKTLRNKYEQSYGVAYRRKDAVPFDEQLDIQRIELTR